MGIMGWLRGDDIQVDLVSSTGTDEPSPLSAYFDSRVRNALRAGTVVVGRMEDLPITMACARFIQTKICAMPRRLIDRRTNEVSTMTPRWIEQANPSATFHEPAGGCVVSSDVGRRSVPAADTAAADGGGLVADTAPLCYRCEGRLLYTSI